MKLVQGVNASPDIGYHYPDHVPLYRDHILIQDVKGGLDAGLHSII